MSFDKKDRFLGIFKKLKTAIENNKEEDLIDLLPRITRMFFYDRPSLIDLFNKYDLLIFIPVSPHISELKNIAANVNLTETIFDQGKIQSSLLPNQFLSAKIGELNGLPISIKELTDAIGYFGTIHPKPSIQHLIDIYDQVVLEYKVEINQLLFQIGRAYISALEIVLDEMFVNQNLFAVNHDRQSKIIIEPTPAIEYNDSFLQGHFEKNLSKGIIISFNYKPISLHTSQHEYAFVLGHEFEKKYAIAVYQIYNKLICKIQSGDKIYKGEYQINSTEQYYDISIEVYPKTEAFFRINNVLQKKISIQRPFIIEDGKIVMGSNLDGNSGGHFLLYILTY